MTARLVVSLSGIDSRTLHRCADLAEELGRRAVPMSLLVAPRLAGAATEWVRTRHAAGDDVLMHGFDHTLVPRARTVSLARRAEFSTLPAHEAGLRLTAAMAAMEREGLPIDGFAPPRWMASRGTVIALERKGFRLCADLMSIRDLSSGTHLRARVQSLRSHERAETWRCFALVLAAARTTRRGGCLRLAIDATDLIRPGYRTAFLDAVDVALQNDATALTYRAAAIAVPVG
ncbi:DUF2334 domain-containing protein [Actinokineospora sp. NBRC 105648]|uniref:DUF2334 domain-containing protein n=1 Tax=Actinokineospora sp. NBRC 105648 TaxID=3032206 RepID=UPI0024A24266|nr:DUF2334 domain-containing protein [Actinokineospora sp. NBRC 105648]GLZ37646.1 DUF2334 domain-containing protein [Actinokineospora sp. NBRC 105648]